MENNVVNEKQFFKAVRAGDIETVESYIEHHKGNPQALNIKERMVGTTATMIAAALGFTNILLALVNAGANINNASSGGFTALIHSARAGQLESVKILAASDADVNAKDSFNNTAIWHAADTRHFGIVCFLSQIKDIQLPVESWLTITKNDNFPSLVTVKYYNEVMWMGYVPVGEAEQQD